MPSFPLWLPGLAVALLVLVLRFMRPRASWDSFRAGALADGERIRRETRRAAEAVCGEEALLPLRALLRELPLPAGVSVREESAEPEELRVLVTSARASLMLRVRCVSCRRAGRRLMSPAALWLLAARDARSGAAASGAALADPWPDRSPDIWQGAWPAEERFTDLAACAARLQNCVADPASALESLHVASDG
ncbi:MAG: hypothetical protein J1E80_02215 [Desulfovibrionaceae bacterium]|nr:hypothetical protein [Desulfovibrionaceae bacterium]